MARTKISEFSATPNDNTDIDGIDIAEGCAPSGINNAIRELMSQLKDFQTGSAGDPFNGAVNGTVGATTPSTVVATQVDITAQGDLRLQDTTGGQYVALQAPGTIATSYTLTLPVDDGTSGQALITDGAGVLSWSSAASGDVYGPGSATDNAVARYDGTTGKIIQNSAVTIGDDGATVIAANSTTDGLRITQTGAGNALLVEDSANPDSSPTVITADGRLVVGYTSASTNVNSTTPISQIHSTVASAGWSSLTGFNWSNSTQGFGLNVSKSRSATIGTQTVVQSGDMIGGMQFFGDDGTNFIRAADILGYVDGTPGTNDMPGRLVFSTTADGASSPTEAMRIDNARQVGIGATPSAGRTLSLGKAMTGSTTPYGMLNAGIVQSDATSTTNYFSTFAATAAASFTSAAITHYFAQQGTFGAGSTVTAQYGFSANSNLTGATNNYGFYGNIASGTGRWNFYAAGTADNYFAGNVGIGTTTNSGKLDVTGGNVYNNTTATGSTGYYTNNGIRVNAFSSDFNANATYIDVNGNFYFRDVNASYVTRLSIQSGVISLGAALGAESLRVTPVASAVNYWNFNGSTTGNEVPMYASGSDTNIGIVLATKGTGSTFIQSNGGVTQFRVAHAASAVNYLQVAGAGTGDTPYIYANGSDANVGLKLSSKGTGLTSFCSNTFAQTQFAIAHTASAVNYLQVTGAATGVGPVMTSQGTDTNINMVYLAKGTGAHAFGTGGGGYIQQFLVYHTASAVNHLQVTGGATGNAPIMSVTGSDTDIDLALTPKGTGVLKFGTYTAGVVTQAGYITIKDAAGNTRRLLVG